MDATGSAEVWFQLLGPLEVRFEGRVLPLGGRTARAVLVALVCHVGERRMPAQVMGAVWGPDGVSQDGLYHYISRLRTVLEPAGVSIESCRPGYRLVLPAGVDRREAVDALRFEDLVRQARQLREHDPEEAAARLLTAVGMWRGSEALAGLDQPGIRQLAHRLDSRRLEAAEDLAELELARGRVDRVLDRLRPLAAAHPDRARLTALLIRALFAAGRPGEAETVFRQAEALARAGGGVDPAVCAAYRAGPGSRPVETAGPGAEPPYQLPADTSHFVGRGVELGRLLALAPVAGREPVTPVVSAVDGMAGIGKTALAVRAAHLLAERFPDGNLFVDLHGFTPDTAPTTARQALDTLLRGLGVTGQQIPPDLGARVALYRSRLARRRVLIVLDNAKDEAQVRPLLPGTPGCLVLVTSRRRLTGLDDAHHLTLDVLAPDDAAHLFRAVASERGAAGTRDTVDEIVRLCGELPLAIRIAAARLRTSRALTPADLLASLRQQVDEPLDGLADGERSVAAAFTVSYRHLGPVQAHTFGLLGVHPGPHIDVYAAAALLGSSVGVAQQCLDSLEQVNLIAQPVPGRYHFHDLLRAYAARSACADDGIDRCAAMERLLNHYSHTASLAMDTLYGYEAPWRPRVAVPATAVPAMAQAAAAKRWLHEALPNLFAVAAYASQPENRRQAAHVVHLAATLARHLRTRGRYHDAYTLHSQALAMAQALGDRVGELTILTALGRTDRVADRHQQALLRYARALQIAREVRHSAGEIVALNGLGHVERMISELDQAYDHFLLALQLARTTAHQAGEVDARWGLGQIYRCLGRYDEASREYGRALELAEATGHRAGQVTALTGQGHVFRRLGDYPAASRHFQRALQIAVDIGDRSAELYALLGRGQVYRDTGRGAEAITGFRRALEIARDIGDRNGQFEASKALGDGLREIGDLPGALSLYQDAVDIARAIGQPHDQARAYTGLGSTNLALGHPDRARAHWNTALAQLTRTNTRRAAEVRAHLEALDAAESASPGPPVPPPGEGGGHHGAGSEACPMPRAAPAHSAGRMP
jgi:tetratricopeptide (TPR) repeat protein